MLLFYPWVGLFHALWTLMTLRSLPWPRGAVWFLTGEFQIFYYLIIMPVCLMRISPISRWWIWKKKCKCTEMWITRGLVLFLFCFFSQKYCITYLSSVWGITELLVSKNRNWFTKTARIYSGFWVQKIHFRTGTNTTS